MQKTGKMSINISVIYMICVMGIMSATTGTLAEYTSATLGIDAESMGLSTTFYAIGMLLGSVAGGILGERYGKRIILTLGAALMGACMFVQSMAGINVFIYLAMSFLGGFGFTPCEANGNALLGDNNPGNESKAINICQMFYAAFAIVAPIAAIGIVTSGASWQVVFRLLAAMYLVAAVLIFSQKSIDQFHSSGESGEKDTMSMLAVFKSKPFCLLCLMMFLMTCYESVAVIYGNIYLLDVGIPETTAAIGVSLYQAGTTLGRFICIFLSGKEAKGMKVLTIFAPIGLALTLFAPMTALRVAGLGLLGLGTGPVWPLLFVLALKQFPEHTAVAGSALDMFMCAGYIIWPTVIGVIMSNASTTLTICLAVACIVYGVALLVRDKAPTTTA